MDSKNMLSLFHYNWNVRDKWFEWCKELSEEDLLKERTGGYKGILHTLFHIVDVEQRWIRGLSEDKKISHNFADYDTLEKVTQFSEETKAYSLIFLNDYSPEKNNYELHAVTKKGDNVSHLYIEILLHISVHEVHHIGQLSVWARELGKEPISANLMGLDLFKN